MKNTQSNRSTNKLKHALKHIIMHNQPDDEEPEPTWEDSGDLTWDDQKRIEGED